LFYTIKKQTFLFQNFAHFGEHEEDVIYCQNENEATSLVAMRSKRIVIGPGKSRHHQLDLK